MGRQIVRVHLDYLNRLIHGHEAYTMTTDLPDDHHIVAAYAEPERGSLKLVMESEEWPDVPENHALPEFMPTVTLTDSGLEAVIKAMTNITCPNCGEKV